MKTPTRDEFLAIVEKARRAGKQAVETDLARYQASNPNAKAHDSCGGAILTLDVDGRSTLGKLLSSLEDTGPDLFINKYSGVSGFDIHINGMTNRQEQNLNTVAAKAALEVLKRELEVDGSVRSYTD